MSELIILASITLLAAISPGPDMIVVVKNAIVSRKLGYMTAVGVGLAVLIHVAYCIAGVGIIISQSILLFSVVKTIGALYLLYIAYQLFRSKKENVSSADGVTQDNSLFSAWREGFLTNVLNPKATLFFLSVFTQVIDPKTSPMTQIEYGIIMAGIVGIWFCILTTIISTPAIKKNISNVQFYLNKVM